MMPIVQPTFNDGRTPSGEPFELELCPLCKRKPNFTQHPPAGVDRCVWCANCDIRDDYLATHKLDRPNRDALMEHSDGMQDGCFTVEDWNLRAKRMAGT